MPGITDADRDLVTDAETVLRTHHEPGKHTTGAALRTAGGEVYTGVSMKAGTGQADVHAEPVALARAILDGRTAFEAVAAVQLDEAAGREEPAARVVSACGCCRELLVEQAPDLRIILREDGDLVKRPVRSLLPG